MDLCQCFEKLSLNVASCQTANSTESVRTAIEPELEDLKPFSHNQILKVHMNCKILQNAQKIFRAFLCTEHFLCIIVIDYL